MNGNPVWGGPDSEPQASARTALQTLQQAIGADFLALALFDREHQEVRWRVAYGARSERYKAIAIRLGKGVAGDVILSGRPVSVRRFPEDAASDPMEYPIMLIEKLVSCYAVPVRSGEAVIGALMAANRQLREFTASDREAVHQAGVQIGRLYASCYQEADFVRAEPQHAAAPSPLMAYLNRRVVREAALFGAEILDQRITSISETLQQEMTEWLDRLMLDHLPKGERLRITVERKEGSWMTLEAEGPGRLEAPHETLGWLIRRVGELKGNVEVYNEPGVFRICLNLPVSLMAEGAPWMF